MPGPEPEWIVLLLGGASGVGKSMMSYQLARLLRVNLTGIDDLQIALETATAPSDLPLLHFWRTNLGEYMSWTDERRVEHHTRVCREVFMPVMRAVIADHLETRTPVVFEGDFLLPELATMAAYGDEPNDGRVRGLFVSEADEAQIAANYRAREGDAQSTRARSSWLFDAFLRSSQNGSACSRSEQSLPRAATARSSSTGVARCCASRATGARWSARPRS
jgi:2-phosphoglycerate kinase